MNPTDDDSRPADDGFALAAATSSARPAWLRFATAERAANIAIHTCFTDGAVDEVSSSLSAGSDLAAGARLLAWLLAMVREPGAELAGRIVAATADPFRSRLLGSLTDEVMADRRYQGRGFGRLMRLLATDEHDAVRARAVVFGRQSPVREVRAAALSAI